MPTSRAAIGTQPAPPARTLDHWDGVLGHVPSAGLVAVFACATQNRRAGSNRPCRINDSLESHPNEGNPLPTSEHGPTVNNSRWLGTGMLLDTNWTSPQWSQQKESDNLRNVSRRAGQNHGGRTPGPFRHRSPTIPTFTWPSYSGIGAYHGKWGFECFSHRKSTLVMRSRPDLRMIYPPYSDREKKLLRRLA